MAILVLLIGIVRLLVEVTQVFARRFGYFADFENYIEDMVYIFAIIFVINFGINNSCWCPSRWQWVLGSLAVFLAWINLILFMKRLPLLGIYVLMFINICYTFLKIALIALMFVVAFCLAFYMIIFQPLNTQVSHYSPIQ